MITLPSSYAHIASYADDLFDFIDTPLFRQITGDIHVNDALILNAWETLPSEWTTWWTLIPDHRLAQQDLIDSIEEPTNISSTTGDSEDDRKIQYLRNRPESLTKWLETLQALSLPRVQRLGQTIILPDVLADRMKTKKIAEVSTATAYIQNVCQANNITHVIDMGSGQGYLSVALAFLYPNLRVLAIDGSESQIAASKACAASLGIPECRIQHMQRYIDGTAPLAAEMAAWAGGNECMLVGLHACGSLSEHMLRYFTTVPFITRLGAVGCCYNHIAPRSAASPDGFPVSENLRKRGVVLSATALMTGCQAPNNWERADLSKEESEYSRRRFYRALMEKVFFDKGIELDRENRPVWGVRKGDTASFTRFARRAVEFLGVDGSGISDEDLASYENRYRNYSGKIAILWTLSVLCCKVVESVIALDRYLFLTENGGENVDVLPIFDYKISPRNLMLVANKGATQGNASTTV
ncbi:protein RRNAD1 [Colletotrichum spaethianum]|uniref:Protein RRNAD1 n=1 Tax=Colletotrichum spaethianum TaxID=700344 RepID=A0AA37PFN9_9PEZI|nr:protein RRNAD1 [Colletotrichum spaethianum]GKT51441.1 protein RRNAD1 [Colletotrichum spaethianum]